MSEPIYIDKQTYKIMKYIYRKREVQIAKLGKKFGEDNVAMVYALCRDEYAAYIPPGKNPTYDISLLDHLGKFALTPIGNKYVESQIKASFKWYIPIIISMLSVAISFLALAISLFSGNEIIVHLAK